MMTSLRGGGDRPPMEGIYIYLFTFLLGYIVADLTILKIRPAMLPTKAPPSYSPSVREEQVANRMDYNFIPKRNLFNADGVIPPAISTKQSEEGGGGEENATPVLSQLPLKLAGTIVHANPNRSVATISGQGQKEPRAYMVDDEIENIARLTKIERRRIVFRNLNNNRLEFIEIPKDMAITFGMKGQEGGGGAGEVSKQGEFDFSIRRDDLTKYTSDLASILNQARMVPNIIPGTGGRVDGFRFVSIQPGSIYEKLGFKPGDVIKSVNNEPVNSPTKAMELYNALRTDSSIKLMVERDGKEVPFTYDVKD